ncbi:hypothetical protein C8R43DRAFT_1043414 [Mycena crocata]|nr:hypothetical protein C8R43DRAFT_1043414 [Mycena crocata]
MAKGTYNRENESRPNPTCWHFERNKPVVAPEPFSQGKKTKVRALNKQGRAICRIVFQYGWTATGLARIFGLPLSAINNALTNSYSPPDTVAEDYHWVGGEWLEKYPPLVSKPVSETPKASMAAPPLIETIPEDDEDSDLSADDHDEISDFGRNQDDKEYDTQASESAGSPGPSNEDIRVELGATRGATQLSSMMDQQKSQLQQPINLSRSPASMRQQRGPEFLVRPAKPISVVSPVEEPAPAVRAKVRLTLPPRQDDQDNVNTASTSSQAGPSNVQHKRPCEPENHDDTAGANASGDSLPSKKPRYAADIRTLGHSLQGQSATPTPALPINSGSASSTSIPMHVQKSTSTADMNRVIPVVSPPVAAFPVQIPLGNAPSTSGSHTDLAAFLKDVKLSMHLDLLVEEGVTMEYIHDLATRDPDVRHQVLRTSFGHGEKSLNGRKGLSRFEINLLDIVIGKMQN